MYAGRKAWLSAPFFISGRLQNAPADVLFYGRRTSVTDASGERMKQQEIERKFLVKSDGWRGRAEGELFRQGYIARTQDRTVRVRVTGKKGMLTIKYRGEGIARSEFEYEIPLEEAQALLDGLDPGEIIEKMRHTFTCDGSVWEVDEFLGANRGLVVAEIELESADQPFVRPEWLGEEVSRISRYLNVELSKLPYTAWTKEEKEVGKNS